MALAWFFREFLQAWESLGPEHLLTMYLRTVDLAWRLLSERPAEAGSKTVVVLRGRFQWRPAVVTVVKGESDVEVPENLDAELRVELHPTTAPCRKVWQVHKLVGDVELRRIEFEELRVDSKETLGVFRKILTVITLSRERGRPNDRDQRPVALRYSVARPRGK
jgi:hypothetical protein